MISQDVVATGELTYNLAQDAGWAINPQAAEDLLIAIMSDSLGLTTQKYARRFIHGRRRADAARRKQRGN